MYRPCPQILRERRQPMETMFHRVGPGVSVPCLGSRRIFRCHGRRGGAPRGALELRSLKV